MLFLGARFGRLPSEMDQEIVSRLVEQVKYMGRKSEETGSPITTDREVENLVEELNG